VDGRSEGGIIGDACVGVDIELRSVVGKLDLVAEGEGEGRV